VAAVDRVAAFEGLRPRLRGLAYRMLGSVGDAEDVVQDAYLRWHQVADEADVIRAPEAWLVTVVTRLSLDRLRARAAERAAYDGPWLPEPWLEAAEGADEMPGRRLERAADLSLAFLALLERLSPEERAAFLLREVFGVGYPEIARTLGKGEAACRQMVHRARERVRQDRPRRTVTEADRHRLVRQFLAAAGAGDQAALLRVLAPDAAYVTDGGGKVWALRRVVRGSQRIARLLAGVARKRPGWIHEPATVNGEAGYLTYEGGRLVGATAIDTDGAQIFAVLRVLNPDKLRRLAAYSPAG
jgi:RNA polymerase sigma-70 factor (ECF subfamily)